MKDKVRAALAPHEGERLVCAVSGGRDSVALLHCLLSLRQELGLEIAAAHYNHCLRGAESDGDEAFVTALCEAWGVELARDRGDPRRREGESPEEAARNLRYAFLLRQKGWIVTAHHAEDQVETVLLNLLRGTGLKGLCGMQTESGRLLRPMLEVTGEEIEAYVSAHDLPCRVDSTNLADDALRNRLRRHVIPLLRQENPNLSRTVARMTDLLRQDEAYLARAAEELLERAARDGGYDCPTLLAAPEVLRRRAIRRLLPVEKPAHGHVLQVERLLSGGEGSASVELPKGVKAVREYDLLCLRMPAPGTFSPVVLRPGETVFAAGLKITMEYPRIPEKEVEFALKYDMMEETPVFTVRPRRSGDTLRLSGGTKSLKKLMIDRKIPRSQRDLLPVFEDAAGIFAVYGLGADASRKAAAGEPAWIIQIEKEERTGNEDEPN